MLVAWLADNNTSDWTVGIKFVQFQKNTAYHSGIKCSPYSAMFGCEAKIGITSSSLPTKIIATLQSDDDVVTAITGSSSYNPVPTSSAVQTVPCVPGHEDSATPQNPALPTSDDSTATHISISSTTSAVPPVPALEDNTTPQNPVIPVLPTSDDSATAHIPVPSTSSTASNLADQSDDDTQQLLSGQGRLIFISYSEY